MSTVTAAASRRAIGIDVSEDRPLVSTVAKGRASRLSNDPTGFGRLIARIGSEVDRI